MSSTKSCDNIDVDLRDMRKPYNPENVKFDISDLYSHNPFKQFKFWFEEAKRFEPEGTEMNAMALATASKDGKPSIRMLLLKQYSSKGFTFFTNDTSLKGSHMKENPHASILFYWNKSNRQIRIDGGVEMLSEEIADDYFTKRPKSSQISAFVSRQSSVIPNREYLEQKVQDAGIEFADKDVPRPTSWRGFRLVPKSFEFWQGQTSRLHDRILFRKQEEVGDGDGELCHRGEDGWVFERLSS